MNLKLSFTIKCIFTALAKRRFEADLGLRNNLFGFCGFYNLNYFYHLISPFLSRV